ncbi:MAG TPA: hypothetical protein VL307_19835 [Chitinophagaceae bacterium]|nr:hypothetical protein [Chitinophagaceae bacterium]
MHFNKRILFLYLLLFSSSVLLLSGRRRLLSAAHEAVAYPAHYSGTHMVLSLLHQQGSILRSVQQAKAAGYNVIWAHADAWDDPYDQYYNPNMDSVISACEKLGGIWTIPGFMNYDADGTAKVKSMIVTCFKRKGVLHINGKPVFAGYGYQAHSNGKTGFFNQVSLDSSLLAGNNIHATDYLLLANTPSPYSQDNRKTWEGETTYLNNVKRFKVARWNDLRPGIPPLYYVTDFNHLLDVWPWVDGLMVFGVDQSVKTLIGYNEHISRVAKERKLEAGAWAGYCGFYASASVNDYGYTGLDSVLSAIIRLPLALRPTGLVDIANDNGELNYSIRSQNDTAGLFYVPTTRGALAGPAMRTPLTDHSGFVDFSRPWIDAFLHNRPTVSFTRDEIFCLYQLHAYNAPLMPVIPPAMLARGFTQAQWDKMIYKNGSAQVRDIQQVPGIDRITMAAHLTKPAYLAINGIRSTLKPAGAAHFSIPLNGFTGIPVFAIIEPNGKTVRKTGNGPQPIVKTVWPGGWNPLARKL